VREVVKKAPTKICESCKNCKFGEDCKKLWNCVNNLISGKRGVPTKPANSAKIAKKYKICQQSKK